MSGAKRGPEGRVRERSRAADSAEASMHRGAEAAE